MQTKSASLNLSNQIKIINLTPCHLRIQTNEQSFFLEDSIDISQFDLILKNTSNNTNMRINGECKLANNSSFQINENFTIDNSDLPKRLVFFLNETKINYASLSYDLNNQKIGFSLLRVVSFNIQNSKNVLVSKTTLNTGDITKSKDVSYSSFDYGKQTLEIINSVSTNNDTILKNSLDLDSCASYTVFLFTRNNNTNNVEYILLTDIYPNGLSLFWQLIQIFVMTVGEIMFSISGLSFAYSQVLTRNIFSILCVIF